MPKVLPPHVRRQLKPTVCDLSEVVDCSACRARMGARCGRQPSRLEMKKLFLIGSVALSVLSASAQAVETFPSRQVWQCGNVRVTWSMNDVPDYLTERPRSWFEYEVKGLEKRDNRFAADDDGLYMNGKLCWPVEPVTCLKPNGEIEPCESRTYLKIARRSRSAINVG